jgi:hypothetical protein
MREIVPYLFFAALALSGVIFGVADRSASRTSSKSTTPVAPSPVADNAPAEPTAWPTAARLIAAFYGHRLTADQPPAAATGWNGQISWQSDFLDASGTARFEGGRSSQLAPPPTLQSQVMSLRQQLSDAGHQPTVRFMIALVSDPIESSADHCDPYLDAIQRAFEAEEHLIDQHHLHWPEFLAGKTERGEPRYRREPGVILFRRLPGRMPLAGSESASGHDHSQRDTDAGSQGSGHEHPPAEIFVVFVVGETPIAGIHKPALHHAITFVDAWRRCGEEQQPIRILGPTYSGSAQSLRLALHEWVEQHDCSLAVEVLSGSATARANKEHLEFVEHIGTHALLSTFHAMYLNTEETFLAFYEEFLRKRLHASPRDVVLIHEGNTSYGDAIARGVMRLDRSRAAIAGADHHHDQILTITYPLQIGRLRTAYEQQNLLAAPATSEKLPGLFRGVDLRLDLNPRASDLPPAMSPSTPAYVERVMLSLLDAIRRENRRYVGLLGSSVEDRLFLAQLLYFRCPDVHLFCFDNNLLYTHPKYNRYLEGMVIATPYPLYPTHHHPIQGADLTLFSSDDAYGEHLACRAVVRRSLGQSLEKLRTDYTFPILGDDAHPDSLHRPPLWAVQVGKGSLVPLAVIRTEGAPDAQLAASGTYTLRLDPDWEAERLEKLDLASMAHGVGVRFAAPHQTSISPPPTFTFHGPSQAYRAVVALLSLLIVLLALGAAFRDLASSDEPALVRGFALAAGNQLRWLAIALIVLQWVAAAPVILAMHHLSVHGSEPLDRITYVVSLLGIPALALIGISLSRAYSHADLLPVERYRRQRIEREVAANRARQPFLAPVQDAVIRARAHWELRAVPIIALAGVAATAALFLADVYGLHSATDGILLAEQAGTLRARLSPLVPLLLCLTLFALVFGIRWLRAKRIDGRRTDRFASWRAVDPLAETMHRGVQALDAVARQAALPQHPRYLLAGCALVLVVASLIYLLFGAVRLTMLRDGIEWALRLGIFGVMLLAVCFICSSEALRQATVKFLDTLHPKDWSKAFDQLPKSVQEALKKQLFASAPADFSTRLSPADRRFIAESVDWFLKQVPSEQLGSRLAAAAAALKVREAICGSQNPPDDRPHIEAALLLLEAMSPADATTEMAAGHATWTAAKLRAAVAPQIAGFTIYLLEQLDRRIMASLVLVIGLMFVLNSYPFQPLRLLLAVEWGLIAAAVLVALRAFISINVNPTLSAMNKTGAGFTLDWNLAAQMIFVLGLPTLAVLSIHFPEFADLFGSAAEAVKSVKL